MSATKRRVPRARFSALGTLFSVVVILYIIFILMVRVFSFNTVHDDSMYPNIQDSDIVVTYRFAYSKKPPRRGDVVVFPMARDMFAIKRVIGIEGDTVRILGGRVFLNGELLEEPYLDGVITDGDAEYTVPDGMLFVMGDNRDVSHDSRNLRDPYIDRELVSGRVFFLFHNWKPRMLPTYITQTSSEQ